jgi:hypothetical protein
MKLARAAIVSHLSSQNNENLGPVLTLRIIYYYTGAMYSHLIPTKKFHIGQCIQERAVISGWRMRSNLVQLIGESLSRVPDFMPGNVMLRLSTIAISQYRIWD